jgi:hypothetical protein
VSTVPPQPQAGSSLARARGFLQRVVASVRPPRGAPDARSSRDILRPSRTPPARPCAATSTHGRRANSSAPEPSWRTTWTSGAASTGSRTRRAESTGPTPHGRSGRLYPSAASANMCSYDPSSPGSRAGLGARTRGPLSDRDQPADRLLRPAVRDWVSGREPRRGRRRDGCPGCGGAIHDFSALPAAYVYLLGLYLGDGCIATHPRGVYKLRLALDAKYPGIIDEAARATALAMPASKVCQRLTPSNCVEVYSYSRAWPCLFPQHGAGPKHKRQIVLGNWQPELIEGRPDPSTQGAHPLRRLPLHQHRPQVVLPALCILECLCGHTRDLLRCVRSPRRPLHLRAADRVHLSQR